MSNAESEQEGAVLPNVAKTGRTQAKAAKQLQHTQAEKIHQHIQKLWNMSDNQDISRTLACKLKTNIKTYKTVICFCCHTPQTTDMSDNKYTSRTSHFSFQAQNLRQNIKKK